MNGAERMWGAVLVMFVAGCFPSKEVRSAGLVGCLPEDIEISSEQRHVGLVQSGDTWVAECRGRYFVCSQTDHVAHEGHGIANLLAADQVSCTEEPESPQETSNREARQLAAIRAAAPQPLQAAPVGAAGFDFGLSADDARQRCEAAGNQWDEAIPELPTCSGTATLGGFASVSLRFCDARTCAVAIEQQPQSGWSNEVVSLKTKLEAKYGASEAETRGIPAKCRTESDFKHCLATRELALRYSWRWASGESLEMTVGKRTAAEPAAIRLVYTRAGSGADASAL